MIFKNNFFFFLIKINIFILLFTSFDSFAKQTKPEDSDEFGTNFFREMAKPSDPNKIKYLNIRPGQKIDVYDNPYDEKDGVTPDRYLEYGTSFKQAETGMVLQVPDSKTHELQFGVYYSKIKFLNNRGSWEYGYIKNKYITDIAPEDAFKQKTSHTPQIDCCKSKPLGCKDNTTTIVAHGKPLLSQSTDDSIEKTANDLSPLVGDCVASKKNPITTDQVDELRKKNKERKAFNKQNKESIEQNKTEYLTPITFYDERGAPIIESKSKTNPVQFQDTILSSDQIKEIDVVARTLYGEMASCVDDGIEYYMAVGKIMLNRLDLINYHEHREELAQADLNRKKPKKPEELKAKTDQLNNLEKKTEDEKKQYVYNYRNEDKIDLTHISLADDQFQCWNIVIYKNPKDESTKQYNLKNLTRSLCPAKSQTSEYWGKQFGGKKQQIPNQAELNAWDNAVKVATNMVLDPKSFRQKTKNVVQTIYTSGIPYPSEKEKTKNTATDKTTASTQNKKPTLYEVEPTVNGKKLENKKCLRIWDDYSDSSDIAKANNLGVKPQEIPKASEQKSL